MAEQAFAAAYITGSRCVDGQPATLSDTGKQRKSQDCAAPVRGLLQDFLQGTSGSWKG